LRAAKLIINPAAGRGHTTALLPEIQAALRRHGIEAESVATRAPRDAVELARRAKQDGFELVIAAGGDGTVHEIVNGLVQAAGDGVAGPLGVIPVGSGNDFDYGASLAADWREACARIGAGVTRRVDVGLVNGEVMVNSAGVGFEAQVSVDTRKVRWAPGAALYYAALVQTLLHSYRTPWVVLTADDERIEGAITDINIANGRRSGGSFLFAPQADPGDGVFDVCIAAGMTRPEIISLVPRLLKGTHTGDRRVRMLKARRIRITSDERLPVHADGELLGDGYAQQIEITMLAGKLEVVG
jgi:diacylglycerol kinase (ATP)